MLVRIYVLKCKHHTYDFLSRAYLSQLLYIHGTYVYLYNASVCVCVCKTDFDWFFLFLFLERKEEYSLHLPQYTHKHTLSSGLAEQQCICMYSTCAKACWDTLFTCVYEENACACIMYTAIVTHTRFKIRTRKGEKKSFDVLANSNNSFLSSSSSFSRYVRI